MATVEDPFRRLSRSYRLVPYSLSAFYLICCFVVVEQPFGAWANMLSWSFASPTWPIELLIPWVSTKFLVHVSAFGLLLGSASAVIWPHRRDLRLVVALSVFVYVALLNSHGNYRNNYHSVLWISMLLVAIPNYRKHVQSRRLKWAVVQGFWQAQCFICVMYMMAGYWKVASLIGCLFATGNECEISQWTLTTISAIEYMSYREKPLFFSILYDYPWVGFWGYMFTIWIHVFSIWFAFRLDLHRAFGILRIFFHFGTHVFFGVRFGYFAMAIATIFSLGPFTWYAPSDVAEHLRRLPVFGRMIRRFV